MKRPHLLLVSTFALALALALPAVARADGTRPPGAGSAPVVGRVHLCGGGRSEVRAGAVHFPALPGTPLLPSDQLDVPAGEFLVVALSNGYLVRVDEEVTLRVRDIVLLGARRTSEGFDTQLDRLVTRDERAQAERLAGTQARQSAADAPAAEASSGPQGFGSGHGRLGGSHASAAPRIVLDTPQVTGRLPPDVIQRVVAANLGRYRLCYENGLRLNPTLSGVVFVRLLIAPDGSVTQASNGGSDIADSGTVACIVRAAWGLSFPAGGEGPVNATLPIRFSTEVEQPPAAPAPDLKRVADCLGESVRELPLVRRLKRVALRYKTEDGLVTALGLGGGLPAPACLPALLHGKKLGDRDGVWQTLGVKLP